MPITEQGAVVRETEIEARPETVFGFFTEPDKMVRWMGASADLDPRPGGSLRVDIRGEWVARGEFVEVVPHERVVFTWGWDAPDAIVGPGQSTVEVTLEPIATGTRVRLEHRDLPQESAAAHSHGWDHYVARLTIAAAGGDPGHDEGPGEAG